MKLSHKLVSLILILFALTFCPLSDINAQFTRQDSIRGMITPERSWWDLNYYHLDVKVSPEEKYLKGKNTIQFTALSEGKVLQIDLQPPLHLTKAIHEGQELNIKHDGNAHFIELPLVLDEGDQGSIEVYYQGNPKEAIRPPWDGGLTFQKDEEGNPFIATSCQGLGASIWWPCKDHMYDEPDSMLLSVNVPKELMDVSNGRLRGVDRLDDGTHTFHWFVGSPINNYGVNLNIGHYTHWQEKYNGENGELTLDYYPLKINESKARKQWQEVVPMMEAFEYWFGPYPFYEDGYKLVEVPYLGMEHQSSITYGNGYQNGYLGSDLSGTGYGLLFDFIIVHESGHEWFANNITYQDIADMWIHESFTNYSESLFLEYHHGKEAGYEYVLGTRKNIANDRPIIGEYGVNKSGSSDMYYKGGNMLHTLRQLVNDDEKWRALLQGLNKEFYHQTVTTKQIEDYISGFVDMDLNAFFDQYLRDIRIPVFEYYQHDGRLYYRWAAVVNEFDMSIYIRLNGEDLVFYPRQVWQSIDNQEGIDELVIDRNFYVRNERLR